MTAAPGLRLACGTSVGAGRMAAGAASASMTATTGGTAARTAPPPPRVHRSGRHILGSMPDLQHDIPRFSRRVAEGGPIVCYRMATMWWYQVSHPECVERVLRENNHNYPKSDLTKRIFRPRLGDGLFTREGAGGPRERRLMQPRLQPHFHRRSVSDESVIPQPLVTLRPRGGVRMIVERI